MVPPTDSAVLDLGGDYGQVELRYPLAALRVLSLKLGGTGNLEELHTIMPKFSADNVSLFIWAGMLHIPKYRNLELDQVKDLVEWSPIPLPSLMKPIMEAFIACTAGELGKEEPAQADEGKNLGTGAQLKPLQLALSGLRLKTSGGTLHRQNLNVTSEGSQSSSMVSEKRVEDLKSPVL